MLKSIYFEDPSQIMNLFLTSKLSKNLRTNIEAAANTFVNYRCLSPKFVVLLNLFVVLLGHNIFTLNTNKW